MSKPGSTWTDEVAADGKPAGEEGPRYQETGETLGSGGLGRVDAVLDRRLGRTVARKALIEERPGFRVRFLREARVTAQLEHPAIVPVYDLAEDDDGRAFYTMRRIRGRTLGAALRDADAVGRLALLPHFVDACQAVAYAHARGVVHRDLKPDNVMVGQFGETVVVDWGLAKVTGADESSTVDATGDHLPPNATRVGSTMGTPAYMSPEQARGDLDAVDTRSDVWGLGAILFEVLSGRPPFDGLPGDTAVDRLRRGEFEDVGRALDDAPPDLVAVVEKALQPEPSARYADATALAADIIAWQTGGLVAAYRYSVWEMLRKTARRHAPIVAIGATALGVVAVGGIAALVSIRAERDRAVDAETRALGDQRLARSRLARSLAQAATHALDAKDPLAAWVLAIGSLEIAESVDARGALIAASEDPFPVRVAALHDVDCGKVVMAATGAVACGISGGVRVWDAVPGPSIVVPAADDPGIDVRTLGWNAAGTRLVAVGEDNLLRTWTRGAPTFAPWSGLSDVSHAVFVADDALIVSLHDGRIGTVARPGASPAWSTHESVLKFDRLAPAADGTVVVGTLLGPVQRWDPRTDVWTALPGAPTAPFVTTSQDASIVAYAGGWGGAVSPVRVIEAGRVYDLDRAGQIVDLVASADGGRLVAAGTSGALVWDGPDWRPRARIPTNSAVHGVALSPDGGRLILVEDDGDLLVWDLPARAGRRPVDAGGVVWDARFFGDGSALVSGGNEGVARVWDVATGDVIREYRLDPLGIGMLGVDGRDGIASFETDQVHRFSLDDGASRWTVALPGVVNDLQAIGDGAVAVATIRGDIARVDRDGTVAWTVPLGGNTVSASRDERGRVVVGHDDEVVWLDASDGRIVGRMPLPSASDAVLPLPGARLLVGGTDAAHVLDETGKRLVDLAGQQRGRVLSVAAHGDRFVTGSYDGQVCVWNADGTALACWLVRCGARSCRATGRWP